MPNKSILAGRHILKRLNRTFVSPVIGVQGAERDIGILLLLELDSIPQVVDVVRD